MGLTLRAEAMSTAANITLTSSLIAGESLSGATLGLGDVMCDFEVTTPAGETINLGYIAETLYSTKSEEVTYEVKKGDTWSKIAANHDLTNDELLPNDMKTYMRWDENYFYYYN